MDKRRIGESEIGVFLGLAAWWFMQVAVFPVIRAIPDAVRSVIYAGI